MRKPCLGRWLPDFRLSTVGFIGLLLGTPAWMGCDGSDGGGGTGGGASSSKSKGTGDSCVGGVIKDGICEGKCKPELCVEGNTCVDNRCVLKCESQLDCIVGEQECAPAVEDDTGADILACIYSSKSTRIGVPCPLTTECDGALACPDGTPCGPDVAMTSCSPDACKPLVCLGIGVGDADAVCTTFDCTKDEDCGASMYCGVRRLVPLECGTTGAKPPPDCIPAEDFNKGGATIAKGPFGLIRNVCRPAGQCAPCQSNLDCTANHACVNLGGQLRCAAACGTSKDCEDDASCVGGYCAPKFGTCTGAKFCEPCLNDRDCAASGPTWACGNPTGNQRACYDASFSEACTKNTDCTKSPSGRYGSCQDTDNTPGVDSCYFPLLGGKFMCWPPN